MIEVDVSVRRAFVFPAPLPATMTYLADFRHVLGYLPHLSLVKVYAPGQYRILYNASSAGVYTVSFYCDLHVQLDETKRVLSLTPLVGYPPVAPRVTLTSLTGQGHYTGRSAFRAAGDETHVDYSVEIRAMVPKRLQLRLVPDRIFKNMAEEIVRRRLEEMTGEFIPRLIDSYRQSGGKWSEEN